MGPFLVLRGTANGPAYVARTIGVSGMVAWTTRRERAIRFREPQGVEDLREAIVTRYGIAAAVVPA